MASPTQRVARRARNYYGLVVWGRGARGWKSIAARVYAWRRQNRRVHVLKTDTFVQHITVTRPSGDFLEDARVVERIGMDRFESGVSYNWLVDMRTGEIAVGQPLDAAGTHTLNDKGIDNFSYNQNYVARAIAVVGMPETKLSDEAADSIARLIAAHMDTGYSTEDPDYVPHSMFAFKDCPCDSTRDRMDEILRKAKAYHSGELVPERVKKKSRVRLLARRVRSSLRRR